MAAGAVATFTTIQQCTLVLNNPLTHASLCSFVCFHMNLSVLWCVHVSISLHPSSCVPGCVWVCALMHMICLLLQFCQCAEMVSMFVLRGILRY